MFIWFCALCRDKGFFAAAATGARPAGWRSPARPATRLRAAYPAGGALFSNRRPTGRTASPGGAGIFQQEPGSVPGCRRVPRPGISLDKRQPFPRLVGFRPVRPEPARLGLIPQADHLLPIAVWRARSAFSKYQHHPCAGSLPMISTGGYPPAVGPGWNRSGLEMISDCRTRSDTSGLDRSCPDSTHRHLDFSGSYWISTEFSRRLRR